MVEIRPETRQVVLGTFEELGRDWLEADRVNWLVESPRTEFRCTAQIRYRHPSARAQVRVVSEDRIRVQFEEPQHGVAPGQAVVLYEGDRVLGGGWIL